MNTQQKGGPAYTGTAQNKYISSQHFNLSDIEAQVRYAMRRAGIEPPDDLILDGKIHKFSTNGKRGDDAGRYQIWTDGIPAGWFQDHRSSGVINFRMDIGRELTPEENQEYRERLRAAKAEREAEENKRRAISAGKAESLLKQGTPASPDHAYLQRKQINPATNMTMLPVEDVAEVLGYFPTSKGERLEGNILILPVTVEGELTTCELIDQNGRKSAIAGGTKKGGCWLPEPIAPGAACIVIGEGAATVLSIKESCTLPVVAALSAGNLEYIARQIRDSHPDANIIILADLIKDTREPDPSAVKAAEAVHGILAIPELSPEQGKDWNDYFVLFGPEKTKTAILGAEKDQPLWPDPLPLTGVSDPEVYPLDAWPQELQRVIMEVSECTQAPIPLIANSLLGALSLACQGLANVARDQSLTGPVSLYLLCIAESGERKSTVDGFFTKPISEWIQAKNATLQAELAEYRAAQTAWKAEYAGIEEQIKSLARKKQPIDQERRRLKDLEQNKPRRPLIPELLFQDITPEELARKLATVWPAGGIVSAEAGSVFGAHAMNSETIVRTLALYNNLWSGDTHKVDRKTSDPMEIIGARLTMCLAIQATTLRETFKKSGILARGTGWLARFLLTRPQSTQGTRKYKEPPKAMPCLTVFHRRITELLELPLSFDEFQHLKPPVLFLTPEAKAAWIQYHDGIEEELRPGGDACDIKDVASKSADNAARLAALFHIYEHDLTDIGVEAFQGAARLAAWHLYEARRFFGEIALPPDLFNAVKLNDWIVEYCQKHQVNKLNKSLLLTSGPNSTRKKVYLEPALKELEERNRLRIVTVGKQTMIEVNPRLLP